MGEAYLIMELLDGEPLSARLTRPGRLSLPDALRIGRQIAATIAVAHARGIIHRDLKPDNLFLVTEPEAQGGERVKVLDFGIAKISHDHDAPEDHARFSYDRLPEQGCGAGLLALDRALALAQDWARCGCAASQACEEGRCVAVNSPHEAPAFGCAVAAGRGGSCGGVGVLMILLLGWLQRIAVSAVHRRRKTEVL